MLELDLNSGSLTVKSAFVAILPPSEEHICVGHITSKGPCLVPSPQWVLGKCQDPP